MFSRHSQSNYSDAVTPIFTRHGHGGAGYRPPPPQPDPHPPGIFFESSKNQAIGATWGHGIWLKFGKLLAL